MSVHDLVQLHAAEPIDLDRFVGLFRDRFGAGDLDAAGEIEVAASGPWRPADVWDEAPERLLWTLTIVSENHLWTPTGEDLAGRIGGMARRQAPITAVEAIADRLPGALVLVHSDAGRSAYASIWRERHFRWSLRVDDGRIAVRSDGQQVIVERPPRALPEGDRTGVLLAGLSRLLGESLELLGADRLMLPDTLAELGSPSTSMRLGREELAAMPRERMIAGK